jgi:predicted metal-dependent phosphoesterase TrpH
MGIADLHVHTLHSWDGTSSVSAVLRQASRQAKLDVIAITDHDEVSGALEAMSLAPSYQIEVIPGLELSTAEGHLLALFVTEKIPAGLPLIESIQRVHDLGGLCVVPHPGAVGVDSLNHKAIIRAANNPKTTGVLVGLETFSSGPAYTQTKLDTRGLARQLELSQISGSDAHETGMIGRCVTVFPGKSAADLRSAMLSGNTYARFRQHTDPVRVTATWVARYLLRLAGWITWDPGPRLPLRLTRSRNLRSNPNF